MKVTEFYERYWQRPTEIGSEVGLEVEPRQALLRRGLGRLPSGAPVLDAGCGAGDFSSYIAGLGYKIVGVDVSTAAVVHARSRYPAIPFHPAAIESGLPFKDESFAAIWFSEVLEHLFDVHQALAELNRVLRPDGLLILTTPYHGLVKNAIITVKGFDTHFNPYLSHIRFFTRRSLVGCLERAGFAVGDWGGIGRTWPVWKSQTAICRKVGAPGPAPEIIG